MVTILVLLLHLTWIELSSSEGLETCCREQSVQSCRLSCTRLAEDGNGRKESLYESCPLSDELFWTCVNATLPSLVDEVTTAMPSRFLHCCDERDGACRSRCYEIAEGDNDEDTQSFISELVDTCGTVTLGDDFWSCLLLATPSPDTSASPPPVDADWPRLQCCFKAEDPSCKTSCIEVQMEKASLFEHDKYRSCLERPTEKSLSTCISDVEVPCKLGCSGMQFCSNFNNRPSQAFRRCDVVVDGKAKQKYLSWVRNKEVKYSMRSPGISVTSIENCLPEVWKAVACVIHLEPCVSSSHTTQLCRKDCLRLLEKCNNSTASPEDICDMIAPESVQSNCIPLDNFSEPSAFGDDIIAPAATIIKNPCGHNQCHQNGMYCTINRLCDVSERLCTSYDCHPKCVLGKLPGGISFINGSVMRVAVMSGASDRCFGYFNCTLPAETSSSGSHQIATFIPVNTSCETEKSCTLPSGKALSHQSHLWIDCNFCYCNYGRLICTKRSCLNQSSLLSWNCNCNRTYNPVCSNNGITFPNECTALCLGYSAETLGSGYCGSMFQCSPFHQNNCAFGSKCIPLRHTCLASDFSRNLCHQFICESSVTCQRSTSQSPVCDESNIQHSSLCSFLGTHNSFGYWGYCEEECSGHKSSPVCGANGETFPSRCHAHSMHISIDYFGKCLAVPEQEYSNRTTSRCEEVTCPTLDFPGCRTVIPQGACCPICGSSIIILYDKKILGDNLAYLSQSYISSHSVIGRLQHHIDYIQCRVFGHVLEDSTLMLTLVPENSFNRYVLSEVCYNEAVKLSTLINNQSPVVTSDLFLSHLVAAFVENGSELVEFLPSQNSLLTTTSSCKTHVPTFIIPLLCIAIIMVLK